jgi:hypothetical protein
MKWLIGSHPGLPPGLMGEVAELARGLGRQVAGDDLFLLALTKREEDPPARRALREEDVDDARVLDAMRTPGDSGFDSDTGVTFSPASYMLQGRAEGIAMVAGDGTITTEHVLLALLWDPVSASSQLLWRLGVSRERVVQRLASPGVLVPSGPLPPQREVERGERVWFDREHVPAVLEQLRLHLPPETSWGFNYEGDRAWAIAESSVDLATLVEQALAD